MIYHEDAVGPSQSQPRINLLIHNCHFILFFEDGERIESIFRRVGAKRKARTEIEGIYGFEFEWQRKPIHDRSIFHWIERGYARFGVLFVLSGVVW